MQHADEAHHRVRAGEQAGEGGRIMHVGFDGLDVGQQEDMAGPAAAAGRNEHAHPGIRQAVGDGPADEAGATYENDAFDLHGGISLLLFT